MPTIRLVAYRKDDGSVPLREWLDSLEGKAQDKCLVRLQRLETLGHELRRPEADYLRNGIYELRARHQRVNYRMLYFFHAQEMVVVSHCITKQDAQVPRREIDLAIRRKQSFDENPNRHTFDWAGE